MEEKRELLFKLEFKGAGKAGLVPCWYSGKSPLRARPQPQKALTHGGQETVTTIQSRLPPQKPSIESSMGGMEGGHLESV